MIQHIKKPSFDADRLALYAKLVRLDKPIGILLLLWPTLWALFIAADGIPNIKVLIVFILGVVLMRSAGCAINDYADRNIDPFIARTKQRPVASGLIQPKEALMVSAVLAFIAFILVFIFFKYSHHLLCDWRGTIGCHLPFYETFSFFAASAFRHRLCLFNPHGLYSSH